MSKDGIMMSGNPVFNGPITINIYNNSSSAVETGAEDVEADYLSVKKSKAKHFRAHRHNKRYYQIKHKPKGLVLLVNNEFFAEGSREGSRKDLDDMDLLWKEMGCDVITKENLSAKELLETVKGFSQAKGKFDFYVVVIMSHGKKDDLVVGTDGGETEVKTIVKTIAKSETFKGKPKLIFFQMCRGSEVETEIDASAFPTEVSDWIQMLLKNLLHGGKIERYGDGNEVDATAELQIKGMEDVLLAFSTQPNRVSFRNRYDGSWFIQSIRRVFAQNAATHDVATLMQMAKVDLNNKMAREVTVHKKIYSKVKETLDFDHTFKERILHIFPGFPKDYPEDKVKKNK